MKPTFPYIGSWIIPTIFFLFATDPCQAAEKNAPKQLEVKSWGKASAYGGNLNQGRDLVTVYSENVRFTVDLGETTVQLIADCCVLDHDLGKATLYGIWEEPIKTKSGFIQKSYASRIDFTEQGEIRVVPLAGRFRKPHQKLLPGNRTD